METKKKDFISAIEASKILRTTTKYIYQLVHRRAIPFYKMPFGRKVVFERNELISLIEAGRIASTDELKSRADTNMMRRLMSRKGVELS